MSCKLQEVASRYAQKGWAHIYFGLVGTNTQIFLDLLIELFGELALLDPENLKAPTQKYHHLEGGAAIAADTAAKGETEPPKETVFAYPLSLPIAVGFGLESVFLPKTVKHEKRNITTGQMITKVFYKCVFYPYCIQNRATVLTHTRHNHFNVHLACQTWKYALDSAKPL